MVALAGDVTTFAVDSTLIAPLQTAINSALTTLVPVGIGIMGTFVGISLIKRIIFTFL